MTNNEIIYRNSLQLVQEGKLQHTILEDGTIIPEAIHTYQAWRAAGFQVKKGEKCITKIQIWKCAEKKNNKKDNSETDQDIKMFMKLAAFFSQSQVEKIA